MDGITCTIEIRKYNINVPIVCLTGNDDQFQTATALNAGVNTIITKPITRTKLQQLLNTYISQPIITTSIDTISNKSSIDSDIINNLSSLSSSTNHDNYNSSTASVAKKHRV